MAARQIRCVPAGKHGRQAVDDGGTHGLSVNESFLVKENIKTPVTCKKMAERNGRGRLDDHEERIGKLGAARKEMDDALIVMAHLESKAAARTKEHAEFIASHQEHIEFMRAADARHAIKMAEFDDKLNAFIDMIGRQQGGIESRS